MTVRMHSFGRLFALPAIVTAAAAVSGCAAEVRDAPADEPQSVAATEGTLLASVPFEGEGRIDFVEIEPGSVVASGTWNADEASAMGEAVRQVTTESTVLQAYEQLSGAKASGDVRARLIEADKQLEVARAMRVDAVDDLPPVADEVVAPGNDPLVDKALSGDAQWFFDNWCTTPPNLALNRYACLGDVGVCFKRDQPVRVSATNHILYSFNQLSEATSVLWGSLSSRSAGESWRVLQSVFVGPRTVNWTYYWTGFKYRYAETWASSQIGPCARYSFSEYWSVRQ